MVWGCMTTRGTGELWFIEGNMDSNMYCDTLKQKMPSLQKLCRTAVLQHYSHPKHTAKRHCLADEAEGEGDEWPSMSPDLNLIEHMWSMLKWKVEKHHVSNIQQLHDVIVEEWKRMPATTCVVLSLEKIFFFFAEM